MLALATRTAPFFGSRYLQVAGLQGVRRRILINGRFLGRPITGVERFARETVRAIDGLIRNGHPVTSGLDVALILPESVETDLSLEHVPLRRAGRLSGHAWEQIELPVLSRQDVLVNLCNTGPVARVRALTCVHDAHVWLAPDNFSRSFRLAYRTIVPALLRTNRRWATVSRFSEQSLTTLRVAPRAADAILANGSDHVSRWSSSRSTLLGRTLPARFVFALASRSPLKNTALIGALARRLATVGIETLLAGASNERVFGREGLAEVPGLTMLGRVEDDDIAFLMERAVCFLFPSLYEGFGIPPVEAMALGCPVISSDRSAMPEVLGDAALLCSPDDLDAWVRAVVALAEDADLRAGMVGRGYARAAGYRWADTAVATLEVARTL